MYVIRYEEYFFTYCTEKKETFASSDIGKFLDRVKQLRELGLTIISTYFID